MKQQRMRHTKRRGASRRVLAAVLAAVMVLALAPTVALADEAASAPSILRQPADATYAENATARFYVAASSPENGYLTYQWYCSGPFPAKFSDPNGTSLNAIVDFDTAIKIKNEDTIGDSATKATLTTTTGAPTESGTHYYYYWAEITNEVDGKTGTPITTRIAEAKVVDRTLFDSVQHGDFEGYIEPYYDNFAWVNDKYGGGYPISEGWWDTTHEGSRYGRYAPVGKNHQVMTNMHGNSTTCIELSNYVPASIYQEIATVPGKIYEWSIDHHPYNSSSVKPPDVIAVVIGPAINEKSDYDEMEVTNYWNKINKNDFRGVKITEALSSRYIKPFQYAYNVDDPVTGDEVCPDTATEDSGGPYRYGVNMNTHFNAIVNQVFAEARLNATSYNANNGVGFNDVDRSYATTYGGKPYYVFISAAPRVADAWYTRTGSYTVPAGQGTTVFAFVSVSSPVNATAGNWLDNIVFRSGTELTVKQEISYSGKTEISADTRSGYAYALAELRGSSAITLYDVSAYYDPDGAGSSPEAVRGPAVGLGDGEQWYAGLGDGGVITFRELTPGKTYRVIGIPELAINEDLGTNIYPADVLDEGYYKDIKIASAKDTDDAVVASVTAGIADDGKAAFVIVENSRSDVQYALRKAESGGAPDTQNPDGKGEWKDGGGSLVFPSLALGTVYYLVARPYGYAEISYADAVYGPEGLLVAVKIETPGEGGGAAADLRADQVGRAGDGMSITVTGTGAANTYAIVDPDTGTIVKTLPGTGEDITFSELDAAKTYQVMTKQSEHGVYTQGVRVYPFPGEITVDYKNGRIRLPADTDTEYVIKNADNDKYALGSADEWLTGAKNGYINLVDGDGKSAVFDALDGSDGKIEYRRAPDGYVGAAVRPARVETFPARPAAPGLTIDYAKELLELGTNAVTLEYTLNATGGVWEPPDKVEEDDGKILILFADLGWTGAARTVYLRIPAAEEQFASAVTKVTINARPSPPSGLSAKVEENGNDITFSGFDQEVPYDYGVENTEDTESGWKYQPIEYTAIGGGNYTIAYNANATYRFRISADNAPASLPVIVKPVPIVIEAVDFGEATYGYESITGQAVSVRNVSADEFHVSFEIVDVYASENEDDSKNNFTLGNKESLDSEGDSELDIAAGSTDNKSIVVTPATGRPAGTYTAKIKATYVKKPTEPAEPAEPTDPEETVEADVRLTVTKAEWKGIDVEIPKSGITENSFDVCVTNAPPGTEISLQGDETQYRTVGIDIEPFSFSDLDPQTAYTVRVETPYNDTNHNQYVGTFPVHTAMPLPKIDGEGADIDIDFINEMLVLSGGLNFENCAVTISGGGEDLTIPSSTASRYGVGSYADKGDFTVSVVRKGVLIPGTGDMYPDSRCVEVFFNGRNEAPEVIARYASTDLSEDGGIEKTSGGAFQYRIAGSGNGGWRNANNRVNTLGINNYEVRTAPNTSAFASKVATVSITPKSLAIEVSSIEQKGGAKGRAATKGLLITFNRPVTGLPADALTLAGPATIGTVTDNGDADAATWFVNIVPTANEGDGSTQIQVTVKNWGYNDQQYTVAAGSEKAVTIYIPKPEQMPAAGIDYEQERLTGLTPGAQYKFGAEGVGSGAITMPDAGTEFPIHESWMTGQANGFSLVRAGGEASVDSAPQLLTIPARRPAPTLEINQPTAAGAEATVSGVNADMEYQSVPPTDSNNWESVADSNITLDLGVYYVRRKANVSAKEFPSAAALVRIYKYGEINFGDALQGYTIGSENGPPASLPVKPATSAGENMSTITDVKWVDSAGNLLEDDAVDELPFVLEGEGKNWSVKLKSDTTLSPGEYAAKIKITYEGEKDNTSIQNVCFNIHHKAEIKKVTTQANGYGLTNELQIKFEYPIALTFADIAVDGAAVKSGTGFTDTDATTPRETYTLAIEPLMGVKKGTSVKVSINVGALGPDYAYQLAHGDGVLQSDNACVTIPRAIDRASVSPPPLPPAAGYSTNYVQFTLAPGPEHFPIDVNALREHPDSVVFKYTDGTELMPTDIRRVDADPSGLTFRAFITPVQTGSVTISISDFGVEEEEDVEGEIKATGLRAGAGYYLDENGNNYLVTLEEAFQVLPSRVYGGDGQEYEAAKYLLRTDADADEWEMSAVYIDGAPITVTGYSEQIALNQPYFFDGESKGPIARQLCVMLQEGWTEANGEHRVVVVLKGRGDPAAVVMIGGKIGVSGLTPRYTLTVEGGAGGGRYPAGRAVAISANAPPSGKAFYKWTLRETDGGAFGNAYAASTSFTMPAGNATVAAEYRDRHATPAARINYENETLENLIPGATYTWTHKSVLTGTFTATDGVYAIKGTWMTATGADGENFSLVRNADENNAASLPQDLRIPARVSAPGVLGQPESFAGFGDGKLIDLNGEMEYRADTDPDTYWVRVEPGAVESENLAPGNYLVRYRADTGAKRFAGKSVTVTVAPSGVTPTWRISVAPASAEIPKAAYGYAAPTPVTVTVTNTGNQPTGELTVTLTDEKTAAFTLGGLETDHTIGNIPINGKVTFTVAPNTGLAADTYSATVTVAASAGNTLPTEYGQTLGGALDTVDFTVSKAAITGFASLSLINAGTADEIESEDGGGVHGKYKPEIINDTLMSEFPDVTAYYAGSDEGVSVPVASWMPSAATPYRYVDDDEGGTADDIEPGEYVFEATIDGGGVPQNLKINDNTPKAIVTVKVEKIEHGVSLDASGHAFAPAMYGYEESEHWREQSEGGHKPFEKVINVKNIGEANEGTGVLNLSLSGDNAFEVVTSGLSIAKEASGEIVVRPKEGLKPETYTATLTVSSGESKNAELVPKTYALSFTVRAAEITGFETVILDGGTARYSATYADDAAIEAALLEVTTVTARAANGFDVPVPVTGWNSGEAYDPNTAGVYVFTATPVSLPEGYVNPHGHAATAEITLAEPVDAETPKISAQPESVYDGFVGAPYTLQVGAEISRGGALTYQWFAGAEADLEGASITEIETDTTKFTKIADATDAAFSVPNGTSGVTYYVCVVTNTDTAATGETEVKRKSAVAAVFLRYAELTVVNGRIEDGGGDIGYFAAGETVRVTADAPPNDMLFGGWIQIPGGAIGDLPGGPSGTFTMPASHVTIEATYAPAPTYTLTVLDGAGGGLYTAGTHVEIAADAPPEGRIFIGWRQTEGPPVELPEGPAGTILMPEDDVTLAAVYGPITYTLTVLGGIGGGRYAAGARIAIAAGAAPEGGTFTGWTQTEGPPVTLPEERADSVVMPAGDVTLEAVFVPASPDTYLLTVLGGIGGGRYAAGARIAIAAGAAPEGRTFTGWTQTEGPPVTLPEERAGSVVMPAGDVTLAAGYGGSPSGGGGSGGGGSGGGGGGSGGGAPSGRDATDGAIVFTQSVDGRVTVDLSGAKADEIGGQAVNGTIAVDVSAAGEADVVIFQPKTGLSAAVGEQLRIEVRFPQGTVTLGNDAVRSLVSQASGPEISVEMKAKKVPELTPAQATALPDGAEPYDLSVYSGNVAIHTYNGELIVTVPYSGRTPVSVWYLAEDGTSERVPSLYNEENKTVTFRPPHLSVYAVVHDTRPIFTDVAAQDWFHDDVAYVYGRGLMTGTAADKFSPHRPMTRGMLVTVLGRYHGVDVKAYGKRVFADVDPTRYDGPYVAWAAENGIVLGKGGNQFAPDEWITRQDFATILFRFANFIGKGPQGQWATRLPFDDTADISDYAVEAVMWAAQKGIVKGRPGNLFAPKANTSRAEAAAMLHRFTAVIGGGDG